MDSRVRRAWEIHAAVDELLHSRLEALLIAHAFLVVAYVELITSERPDQSVIRFALVTIICLALLLTALIMRINHSLSNGLRYLKKNYLELHDPVYGEYMNIVRGEIVGTPAEVRKAYPRILSFWIPLTLLLFWAAVAVFHFAPREFGLPQRLSMIEPSRADCEGNRGSIAVDDINMMKG